MNSRSSQASFTLHALQTPPTSQKLIKHDSPARQRSKQETLWYAVWLPQFACASSDSAAHLERQQQIAQALSTLSSTVTIASVDSFSFEVASSLSYFGGINNIRSRLTSLLSSLLTSWQLPTQIHHAVSPTPAASLLMAKAACNLLVYRKHNLRAALGRIPLQALPLSNQKKRQFHNSGLSILRDVWRLPSYQLGQRFGRDFLKQLEQCLGHVANPVARYDSPVQFSSELEWEFNIENKQALLPGIEELVERLCAFLLTRELAATRLCLSFFHEHHEPTLLHLDLRQASRQHAHLILLLETRLNAINLHAATIGMRLEVKHFQAVSLNSAALKGFAAQDTGANNILPLLEELQARLGNSAVRRIQLRDEHCPELASQDIPFGEVDNHQVTHAENTALRPFWLLPKPVHLEKSDGRLFYHSSLRLVSGPERIETHWWKKQEVKRDYYVASNRQGMRLWIFHERTRATELTEQPWYLHGIFA